MAHPDRVRKNYPGGLGVTRAVDRLTGIGIRFVKQYVIQTAQRVSRLDVLYGIPEIAPAFWYWPWLAWAWRKVTRWWECSRPAWMRPLNHGECLHPLKRYDIYADEMVCDACGLHGAGLDFVSGEIWTAEEREEYRRQHP